ncbi:hypothetical protein [Rhizobium sp. P38BS-XIX]|uniref:hypothetical protein n=1 Tax=Rhizobium sp. P38BS-XIX TaxID=2726740 RepID=UPI001FEF270E|nr:hypothetical protein [Rhizobium sp. P38BS-XIX]
MKPGAIGMKALRIAVTALIVLLPLTAEVLAEDTTLQWLRDPASKCRFVAPASLTPGPTYWTGDCPDGKASGLGMLRRRDGNRSGFAFYGEMRDGVPTLGVIDLDGGYKVGKFTGGDIGEDDLEWQPRLDAFNSAVNAARAVSKHYAAEKNSASAHHYESVAKTLEMQIE